MTTLVAFVLLMLWGWYKNFTDDTFSPSIAHFCVWAAGLIGVILSLVIMTLEKLQQ